MPRPWLPSLLALALAAGVAHADDAPPPAATLLARADAEVRSAITLRDEPASTGPDDAVQRAASVAYLLDDAVGLYAQAAAAAPDDDAGRQLRRAADLGAARAHAQAGRADAALDALGRALDGGPHEAGWLEAVEADPDLAALRPAHGDRFAAALDAARARRAARLTEEARAMVADAPLFPFRFAGPALEGGRIRLGRPSDRPTVVVLWGTWSKPSRDAALQAEAVRAATGDLAAWAGLVYERGASPFVVRNKLGWMEERDDVHLAIPQASVASSVVDRIPDAAVLPVTLVLDRQGDVRVSHRGPWDVEVLEALVRVLAEG